MKRPLPLWLLVFFLVFLSSGGLYGGISMLADPTGRSLQMDEVLPLLHIPNYILPGIFLVAVMGLAPLFLVVGLVARPGWRWLTALFRWSGHHWAWTGSLLVGVVLAIWLALEAVLIGFLWPIQYVSAVNGLLIILLALLPRVRKPFQMP